MSRGLKEWMPHYVAAYIHGSYRMGVLVGFNKEAEDAGKDVAMQIAAMNPIAGLMQIQYLQKLLPVKKTLHWSR